MAQPVIQEDRVELGQDSGNLSGEELQEQFLGSRGIAEKPWRPYRQGFEELKTKAMNGLLEEFQGASKL